MNSANIYNERYAPEYLESFIQHPFWERKGAFNTGALSRLLKPLGEWIDVCCGQGWHLAQFPYHRRIGIDASAAQLRQAKRRNPNVDFIHADICEYEFPGERRFDLVSCFGSSYSYMEDEDEIGAFVQKMIRWTAPDGALYIEITDPAFMEAFNECDFALETGTRVVLQSSDGVRWQFHDSGGVHRLKSPKTDFFIDLIEPHFAEVDYSSVIQGHRQVIARRKKAD